MSKKMNKTSKKKANKSKTNILKYVGIAIVALLVFFYIVGLGSQSCDTAECFIDKANLCEKATYETQEEYGLVLFTTEDCKTTKTIIKLDESEDPELKSLIEGKSLVCENTQDGFDNRWIYNLLSELDNCEGELKDIMQQLIVLT